MFIVFACLAAGPGVFSQVTLDQLDQTPILAREVVFELAGDELAAAAVGLTASEADPGRLLTADGFRLRWSGDLAAVPHTLEVQAVATNSGNDSLWVDLDGEPTGGPFPIRRDAMGGQSHLVKVSQAGHHELVVRLREAPGMLIERISLSRVGVAAPQPPMTAARAASRPRLLLTSELAAALPARAATELGRRCYRPAGTPSSRPPAYHPQRRTTAGYRSLPNWAAAQLVSPSEERLAGIVAWLEEALTFPEWGHGALADLDLDAAYMMEGLALTYDWLYDQLPADLRQRLRETIADHARIVYEASLAGRTGGGLSFQQNHFWFAHLILGLGAGAVYGEVPEAEAWLAWCWDRFERVFLSLGDDGGFHEGPAYYDFSMPTLFKMIDLYEQLAGVPIPNGDEGLRRSAQFRFQYLYPGLTRTAAMEDTTLQAGRPPRSVLLWLAGRYHDPVTQALALELLQEPENGWLMLLALDPDLAPADWQPAVPTDHWYPDVELVFSRSGWDPEALFTAFICRPLGGHRWAEQMRRHGFGGAGHNHPAQGHYVLFAEGEVLAADPGYTYEKKTANHNTILVDGQGQYGDGEMWPRSGPGTARILGCDAGAGACFATGEATGAYPAEVGLRRFERTLVRLGDAAVVVYDRLAADQPRVFTWLHHIHGQISPVADGWRLATGAAALRVVPLGPTPTTGQAIERRPQFVHPTRDLTPDQAVIQAVELTTAPVAEATLLTVLLIERPGRPALVLEPLAGQAADGVRIGADWVLFNRGDGPTVVTLPGGPEVTLSDAAALVREGRVVLVHRAR